MWKTINVGRAAILWSLLCVRMTPVFASSHKPPWPPTYAMKESLISMQCNGSGWSSPSRGADFGIVSYDWSNAKAQWAASKPMDCEERLLKQAVMTKGAGAKHVFVYRNLVKALPWFTTVREKMDDPSYAGFFLRFDPNKDCHHVPRCAAENRTHCSAFYHDQLQTPQVPTPHHPHPDGSCDGDCDCGVHPCGEYLFDYRNGSMLQDFLVDELILGPTAVGHPAIDGVFLDDYWCSDLLCAASNNTAAACPCDDPRQGPTEIDSHSQIDMGLSNEDVRDLALGWQDMMIRVKQVLLDHGAYTWSLMEKQDHADAMPTLLTSNATECRALLRGACCCADSPWQLLPQLFGFSVVNGTKLAQLRQDLAFFLLARGPYTWAGWGVWGMTWPFNPEPAHGGLPPLPHGVPLPPEFSLDYGTPLELCYEWKKGIFRRRWSNVVVALDCNKFEADMIWRNATYGEETAVE